MSRLAAALSARIAATRRRLKAGGLLQPIEWLRESGPIDQRGRQAVTTTLIDVFIQGGAALDRSRLDTERADDIVLVILEPLAITDSDLFRWAEHTYSVTKIDGIIQDEETGTKFFSEITVIR